MVDIAVITAKDEAASIGWIVNALRCDGFEVVVISDGSIDNTGIIAAEAGASVIFHKDSQGIGPSLLEAWRKALDMGAERVVQLDAGGSHNPYQARGIIEQLQGGDFVIGSRFIEGGKYEGRKWRAFASRLAAWMLNFAGHTHFTDWTSGYRAFSRKTLEDLLKRHYWQRMHAWQIEVLEYAIEDGLKVIEAPISYVAGNSSLRWSHIDDAFAQWLWLFHK